MNEEMRRLDAFLVANGYVSGREKAKELIEAGAVTVNGVTVTKSAKKVMCADAVTCDTSSVRFVGRGGLKLEKALQISGLDVTGCVALDVGASTGGFTDCLLQAGAKRVYAVDVGTDQLHPALRADDRVIVLEDTDIRSSQLKEIIPTNSVDVCAIDVSFISLKQVIPSVLPFLKNGAHLLCLIKPQFEAGKAAVGKKGVVRDKKVHHAVLQDMCGFFTEKNLTIEDLDYSPVKGGEGNIEFLIVLVYSNTKAKEFSVVSIKDVVEKAHQSLR
jgi:23S rRNA (cytidine1920-2'-O)/16S rRNA (cytidine1409-2'-O)-methyltransferase